MTKQRFCITPDSTASIQTHRESQQSKRSAITHTPKLRIMENEPMKRKPRSKPDASGATFAKTFVVYLTLYVSATSKDRAYDYAEQICEDAEDAELGGVAWNVDDVKLAR